MLHLSFRVVILGNGDLGDGCTSMHKGIFDGLCVFFCPKQSSSVPTAMALLTGNKVSKGLDSSFLQPTHWNHRLRIKMNELHL